MRDMKILIHIMNCIFSVMTCAIVMAIQEFCPEKDYSLKSYLLIAIFVITIGISCVILCLNIKNDKKLQQQEKNERAGKVLSKITELAKFKSKLYSENTYEINFTKKELPYYYNVHRYLYDVCQNLKSTVADIISTDESYIDVSLIYKYTDEDMWKWIAGKSGMSRAVNLNLFVNDRETLFNYVINNRKEMPIICNDKTKSKHYCSGSRDRVFDGQGSFYVMPIAFSNNEKGLVDSILMISTYGVNFLPIKAKKKEINNFKRIIAHEIVRYYVEIIQSELGALYVRHILKEKLKDKSNQKEFIKNIIK